jgi:hypothetical protein
MKKICSLCNNQFALFKLLYDRLFIINFAEQCLFRRIGYKIFNYFIIRPFCAVD